MKIAIPLLVLAVTVLAYFAGVYQGKSASHSGAELTEKSQISLIEIDRLQDNLTDELNEVDQTVEKVNASLAVLDQELALLDTEQSSQDMAELNQEMQKVVDELEALAQTEINEVPIPADSPTGKVLALPKTQSGIPVKVVQEYQAKTGVDPKEIEEIMRR